MNTNQSAARPDSHAGSWYSSDGDRLQAQIRNWMNTAGREASIKPMIAGTKPAKPDQLLSGVIAPHAGYRYAGSVLGHSYRHMQDLFAEDSERRSEIQTIIILGPSHSLGTRKSHITLFDVLQTPLGDLKVDAALRKRLLENELCFAALPAQHDTKEHSLEMQFPYIAHCISEQGLENQIRVLPILVGQLSSPKGFKATAKALHSVVALKRHFFVISSDFCHWGDRFDYTHIYNQENLAAPTMIYKTIKAMDHMAMKVLACGSPDEFQDYLRETGNTICGRDPIMVFLCLLKEMGLRPSGQFWRYAMSSKISYTYDPKLKRGTDSGDSSVSYVSGGFYV